ncbi:hypothetical protein NDU88_004237 [Pleurodeles waltl]|uniref:Uncharacterized protein n=1 Tax=Pleurodeles waltl TaxID=8319 RepID=A0AAV7NIT5_PLEWA|nr:hypothetical protein NDU88_004237 [Pleurodeles waltl]
MAASSTMRVSRIQKWCTLLILYLDDWCSGEYQKALMEFRHVMVELGVPLAPEKAEGPITTITFLGVEFDLAQMEVCLLRDKCII